jgi:putative ABC transport system ATP-binding protein
VIELYDLRKVHVRNKVQTIALDAISLKVEKGEFVSVMGPSGCGKSTLLNILGLIDRPTSGRYLLDGVDVTNGSERETSETRNRNIGFVFQNFNLLEEPTVFENVELPLLYRKVPKAERKAKVSEVLERLGLAKYSEFHPNEISGGEQQRVAVARALVGDPKIILADEPTGNLDSKAGTLVIDLLAALNARGATVVMVTHSRSHAERAHRVIHMLDGRVISA